MNGKRSRSAVIASRPTTIEKGGKRRWIHADRPKGRWQSLRHFVSAILLGIFYAAPWLSLDGRPFLKLSFLSPSFVLFGNVILQQEIFRFVLLALLLVVTLFMASTLIGRAWCGYACPQTIFIEQILGRIETLVEGPAAKRLAAAKKPLTADRILRKVLKHFLYLVVSFSFAFTLLALFTGPDLLLNGQSTAAWIAVAFVTAIAWFDGGYWREQFCHIACPYARFQSVMQDQQTRTIGYDIHRGEPRGRKKASAIDIPLGDCIDCGLCVRVCPSGIDIRQGAAQLECTACARCIDACDSVMTSLKRPQGLIRYDALGAFDSPPSQKRSWWRPRVFAYAVLWCGLFGVGLWQYLHRDLHHVKLLNVKGTLPYFVAEDRIKNLLTLKVGNQAGQDDIYVVSLREDSVAAGAQLESPPSIGPVSPGHEKVLPTLVSADARLIGQYIYLEVESKTTGQIKTVKKLFAGPSP